MKTIVVTDLCISKGLQIVEKVVVSTIVNGIISIHPPMISTLIADGGVA